MSDHDFVHLHVHTEFSLLDGLSKIKKLVAHAKSLDMRALAITDHGTMFGVIDFYRACKAADIKPILGVEGYQAKRTMQDRDSKLDAKPYHLLMLAQTMAGYKNLLKIASAAQLEGYYYKPRIDRQFLIDHADGIITTTGCLAAQIPSLVMDGQTEQARALVHENVDIFGRDNFYLELQQHDIPELKPVNDWLIETAQRDNLQLVATNDVHYVLADDYDAHDTLLCIQTSALKHEEKRMRMTDNSYFLSDQALMWQHFGHIQDGAPLLNSLKIAEMCELNLDDKEYHLPVFPVPKGYESESYLRYLANKGLSWRFPGREDDAALRQRLEHELNVINDMGFPTYFLIVWDLCQFALAADIWWNVRGSGAGSLVAYCLGITNIDPILNNLLFERFLNPGRVSMPDIDIDFPDDRRSEMIAYCSRKYGEDKVAAIITFGTMGAKAAVRDVGRALDVPLELVNQAARLIPTEPKPKPIMEYVEDNPDLKRLFDSNADIRRIIQTAENLQGVTRHASTHAAGIIVADKPLVEYVPLHRLTNESKGGSEEDNPIKQVTQYPMETAESIGLLKIDFLGLSTLSQLRLTCELIERYHGIQYDMGNIPYRPSGDAKQDKMLAQAFEMIARGESIGVFQIESTGMQEMLRGMRPTKFEHIVAAVSLYRPGPMDYIPEFNARMHGTTQVVYHHEKLRSILEETYGICVTGDTLVFDVATGARYRVDTLADKVDDVVLQGVLPDFTAASGRVTHWVDNGVKPVYRVTLRNGATIKTTLDHQFLTEMGWQALSGLQCGDYVATPRTLLEPDTPRAFSRAKLRVLAYLIADGSLASGAEVAFVNKETVLLDEYISCLEDFGDLTPVLLTQIHDVTRVGVRGKHGKATHSLLAWMRELGLKYPANGRVHPAGKRSHEKSIPDFVFQLSNDDLAYFLASLWDCDGYVGKGMCHYKTISEQLARDVQSILLRFGIPSIIHLSHYESVRGARTAYQVTTYDTARLAAIIQPYMVTVKRALVCESRYESNTIGRERFIQEIDSFVTLSRRALMKTYGIDRQHFQGKRRVDPRITTAVVSGVAEAIPLPRTQQLLNVEWLEIVSIEPAGNERVYDITVAGLHNFVGNGIVVHNCVYQEQIMQIASELFGYSLADADLMRRAVSKKKKEDLLKHKTIFMENGPQNGIPAEASEKIFEDIEFFANYGFNKSHAADYAVITVQSAFTKCHYPEEYMAALLTIYFDDSDKVTTFLAECKRLNIPILQPDVNARELNFTIQKQADGRRGIRFGLAAVKNAGVGALTLLINAREQGGEFRDLQDLCERVDLRQVGKRTIESLIKVGALGAFGGRAELLSALDRLISYSGDYHKAKDIGQMSMFGGTEGIAQEDILGKLPDGGEVSVREMLNWEKELLGFYVSSHPIDPVLHIIQGSNFDTTKDLKEAPPERAERPVKIIGLVAGLRKLPTKNKDMMAVVQLEDHYSRMDVVFFPRAWNKVEDQVYEGAVLQFMGKLDLSRGDAQIIGEGVTDQFQATTSDGAVSHYRNDAKLAWMDADEGGFAPPPPDWNSGSEDDEAFFSPPEAITQAVTTPPTNGNGDTAHEPVAAAALPPPIDPDALVWLTNGDESIEPAPPEPMPDEVVSRRLLRVQFPRSGDSDKDARRFGKLIQLITSYPGEDHFIVQVDGEWYTFDEHKTGICDALLQELHKRVGADNIAIEG